MDFAFANLGKPAQTSTDPGKAARRDNPCEPREDGDEHGSLHPFTRKTSLALEAQLHPVATAARRRGQRWR